jgi:hypothetical protein
MTSRITINGVTITSDGNCVSINNGKIIVDGREIYVGDTHHVKIIGDVGELNVSGNVEVHGNVEGDIDAGGHVTCGDVKGNIDAGGSVSAKNANQNIDAGGSVHIGR